MRKRSEIEQQLLTNGKKFGNESKRKRERKRDSLKWYFTYLIWKAIITWLMCFIRVLLNIIKKCGDETNVWKEICIQAFRAKNIWKQEKQRSMMCQKMAMKSEHTHTHTIIEKEMNKSQQNV